MYIYICIYAEQILALITAIRAYAGLCIGYTTLYLEFTGLASPTEVLAAFSGVFGVIGKSDRGGA